MGRQNYESRMWGTRVSPQDFHLAVLDLFWDPVQTHVLKFKNHCQERVPADFQRCVLTCSLVVVNRRRKLLVIVQKVLKKVKWQQSVTFPLIGGTVLLSRRIVASRCKIKTERRPELIIFHWYNSVSVLNKQWRLYVCFDITKGFITHTNYISKCHCSK